MYMNDNNVVKISGVVSQAFESHHTLMGETFYQTFLEIERDSKIIDRIPVVVSDRLFDITADCTGMYATVQGSYRSYNEHPKDGSRSKLILYVFANEFDVEEVPTRRRDSNMVHLDCYICKSATLRGTPLGREISDVLIAVNRQYGHSDYLPCICWGRNAKYVASLTVGTHLYVEGRIQSRLYLKKYDDGTQEDKIAYEVSVQFIEKICDNTDEAVDEVL